MDMLKDLRLTEGEQPIYRQLADAIAERISTGQLEVGERLPPQREIARSLGVNLTTVTRAFATLQQRGLIEGKAGRGTVVRRPEQGPATAFKSAPSDDSGIVDLSVNRPATTAYLDALATLLPRLAKDARYPGLQDYHPPEGPHWARKAVADWLQAAIGPCSGQVILTDGAQHGLACTLISIARPGDVILADAVTYQGINALCRSLGLDLRSLAMDRQGMMPDQFETACRQWRPRAVFLVPSYQNPTAVTLSMERRRALLAVARQHNVILIEDDVYRPLLDAPQQTFASLAPDLTVYVSGFSKCVAPGLRLGFVVPPRALVGDVAAAVRINCWSISPLTALIGTAMLEDGVITDLVSRQKEELRQRQALVRRILADFDIQTGDTSTHFWLHLPEPWRSNVFVRVCQRRGIGVLGAEAFAVGRDAVAHAVRVNVAAARSHSDLVRALESLADLLRSGHLHLHDVI
jgi:DNA-binding transcriptional MocR family regulator